MIVISSTSLANVPAPVSGSSARCNTTECGIPGNARAERGMQRLVTAAFEPYAHRCVYHVGEVVEWGVHRSALRKVRLHSSPAISASGSTRSTPCSAAARGIP